MTLRILMVMLFLVISLCLSTRDSLALKGYGETCSRNSECTSNYCSSSNYGGIAVCSKYGSDTACTSLGGTCNQPLATPNNSSCTTTSGAPGTVIYNLCLSPTSLGRYRCCVLPQLGDACGVNGECISSSASSGAVCKIVNDKGIVGIIKTGLCGGSNVRCCQATSCSVVGQKGCSGTFIKTCVKDSSSGVKG